AMFRIMHNLCQWCALGVRGRNWVGEGREAWFWGVMAPRIELWITGTSLTQGQELWVDAMATQGDSLRFSLYNNGNRVFFHTLGHRDTVSNTVIIPMNHLGTNRLVVQSFWASTGVVTATEVRYVTVIAGVGSLPGIPVQLAPTRTGNSITVHWNAPTSGSSPTGYNIFLGSAQSGFMGHFSVPSNARRFTIPAGWIEGSCYWFYVEATNDRGVSGFSDRRYSTPHAPISIRNNVFDFPTALVSPVTFFEPSAEAQNAVRMEIRLNGRVIARSNTDHISFHGVVPADLRNLGYHELQFRAYCRNGISTAITRRILVTPPVNQRVQIGLWYVPQRPAPKNVVPLNVRHIPCVNLPTSQWAAWGLSVGRGISWWNNSASNVSFQTVGATATANTLTVSYSSSSVIGELHNYWGNHLHGRTHHPRTTILINTRTIFRVSIRYGWTPTQLQNFVANVVAHELGHAVGLEDNPRRDNGTSIHSVMTQCAHTLVTMSGPTTNDIAYVNRAYPRVP
ncbi:MAG: fibronectin type III domain-containing protein, partial [Oscillospiraceae bacterium]|nr:fibronectin type III domain-containing protein [Oscillospiraceae bacterium]